MSRSSFYLGDESGRCDFGSLGSNLTSEPLMIEPRLPKQMEASEVHEEMCENIKEGYFTCYQISSGETDGSST
jgi:hypothetical protein